MKPRTFRTSMCVAVATSTLATFAAATATRAQGPAETPVARGDRASTASLQALPPIVSTMLVDALEQEEDARLRGWDRVAGPRVSFPLRVCLFEYGLCGAVNRDGSLAVPPQFDFVDEFHDGRALVRSNGLYGYVDTNGKIVIEPQYPIAGRYRLGLAEVDVAGRSALIDLDGKQILEPRFAGAVPFTKTVFWVNDGVRDPGVSMLGAEELPSVVFENTGNFFRNKAKWGLIDVTGAWIRQPEFHDIAGFDPDNDNLMWAQADTGWGLIRPDGSWQLEPTFKYKHRLSDNRAEVWRGDRSGYIDRTGRIVIPLKFDLEPGSSGFVGGMPARAKLGRQVGLIDQSGAWVVEPAYDGISPRDDWIGAQFKGFVVRRGGRYGLLDPSGKVVMAPALEQYRDPAAGVRSNANGGITIRLSAYFFPLFCPDGRIIGLIDQKPWFFERDGKALTLAEGEISWPPDCDAPILIKVGDRFGFVDGNLQPITEAKFEWAGRFYAGLAAVKRDGKVGLIRTDGTWAIEPKFDAAEPLRSDLALAKLGDRAGVVSIATGTWVTQTPYEDICALGHGVAGVMRDGKMGAIDQNGRQLFEPRYQTWAFNYFQELVPVRSDGKWGFVDGAGNAIAAKFDEVTQFKRGVSWVKNGIEWCAIDRRGNRIPSLQCQAGAPRYAESPRPEQTIACRISP